MPDTFIDRLKKCPCCGCTPQYHAIIYFCHDEVWIEPPHVTCAMPNTRVTPTDEGALKLWNDSVDKYTLKVNMKGTWDELGSDPIQDMEDFIEKEEGQVIFDDDSPIIKERKEQQNAKIRIKNTRNDLRDILRQ